MNCLITIGFNASNVNLLS